MKFRLKIGEHTGTFDVDEAVLEKIDPMAQIAYKGEWLTLKDMKGDLVIEADNITIAQIAWLLKNRNVIYLHMEKTDKNDPKQIAIGVEG